MFFEVLHVLHTACRQKGFFSLFISFVFLSLSTDFFPFVFLSLYRNLGVYVSVVLSQQLYFCNVFRQLILVFHSILIHSFSLFKDVYKYNTTSTCKTQNRKEMSTCRKQGSKKGEGFNLEDEQTKKNLIVNLKDCARGVV